MLKIRLLWGIEAIDEVNPDRIIITPGFELAN